MWKNIYLQQKMIEWLSLSSFTIKIYEYLGANDAQGKKSKKNPQKWDGKMHYYLVNKTFSNPSLWPQWNNIKIGKSRHNHMFSLLNVTGLVTCDPNFVQHNVNINISLWNELFYPVLDNIFVKYYKALV